MMTYYLVDVDNNLIVNLFHFNITSEIISGIVQRSFHFNSTKIDLHLLYSEYMYNYLSSEKRKDLYLYKPNDKYINHIINWFTSSINVTTNNYGEIIINAILTCDVFNIESSDIIKPYLRQRDIKLLLDE
jgi:hypothetical protein